MSLWDYGNCEVARVSSCSPDNVGWDVESDCRFSLSVTTIASSSGTSWTSISADAFRLTFQICILKTPMTEWFNDLQRTKNCFQCNCQYFVAAKLNFRNQWAWYWLIAFLITVAGGSRKSKRPTLRQPQWRNSRAGQFVSMKYTRNNVWKTNWLMLTPVWIESALVSRKRLFLKTSREISQAETEKKEIY